uniref:Mitochondrial pyruvate carrier n=1 Tax=Haemonchus contortus TaxID=6289 RepID=W6ND46_HAECO
MGPHRMLYAALCRFGDKVVYPILPAFAKPAWNHPAGPKTVFFWAPTIKWALVGAGLADLARPAQKLSPYQNTAICATGAIWTRYSDWCNWSGSPTIDTQTLTGSSNKVPRKANNNNRKRNISSPRNLAVGATSLTSGFVTR